MRIFFLIIISFFVLAIISFFFFRKSLPYDLRVINFDGSLLIHNKTIWNNRPLAVEVILNDVYEEFSIDSGQNSLLLEDYKIDEISSIAIYREDLIGKIIYKPFKISNKEIKIKENLVVFIGASIGLSWNLEELSERLNGLDSYEFLYWPVYKFDKSKVIDHVMKIPIEGMIVFLKECGVYFPRNEEKSIEIIKRWKDKIESRNNQFYAVNTFQVTRENSLINENRSDSIKKYNNLLLSNNVKSVNLNSYLISDSDNFLDSKFADEDGLHLNDKAYSILDNHLRDFIVRGNAQKNN